MLIRLFRAILPASDEILTINLSSLCSNSPISALLTLNAPSVFTLYISAMPSSSSSTSTVALSAERIIPALLIIISTYTVLLDTTLAACFTLSLLLISRGISSNCSGYCSLSAFKSSDSFKNCPANTENWLASNERTSDSPSP
ncbi:hypothetical protein D3C71_1278040 [compost metagenome]